MLNASPFKQGNAIAIGWVLVLICGVVLGETNDSLVFRQQTDSCMGTKWHIALYADRPETANTALAGAWQEIREIDRCLSNYAKDSELNQFCRSSPHAEFIQVSEHLATVLLAAQSVSEQTDGYFDVTIGPIANLWRRARATHRLPNPDRLRAARQCVNYRFVEFGPARRMVRITEPRVRIDLGGIAKGYAVDRAIEVLQTAGVKSALVNGGGDLRAMGSTPDSVGWTVEIATSGKRAAQQPESLQFILTDAAVATSGDAYRYMEVDGTRYSHLIDPKTGIGATRRRTVSVYAKSCMQADALASALSVMPSEAGSKLVATLGDVAARIVDVSEEHGVRIESSPGFPSRDLVAEPPDSQ